MAGDGTVQGEVQLRMISSGVSQGDAAMIKQTSGIHTKDDLAAGRAAVCKGC